MLSAWYSRRIIAATTDTEHNAVRHVQRVLRCDVTGELDEATKSHLRGLQMLFNLRPTGILDDATANQVERIWPYGA